MEQSADVHTLGGNADSVEFCPIDGFQHFLAAATYNLVEGDHPQRLGQLYLFDVETQLDAPADAPRMRCVHEQDTAGIFDLKWAPQFLGPAPCLGQASADGSLSFYSLRSGDSAALEPQSRCAVSEAMCLSLDWRPRTGEDVVVSQSDGQIALAAFSPSGTALSCAWPAHDLEVWVAAFDRWDANLVYSGADDCAMKGWDLRTDCGAPVFSNRKEHGMGVCTIASNPWKEHEFVSGSYDERVRVWDNRSLHRPVCVHVGAQVGGGVWRLKSHPHSPGILLGACMHAGARIFAVAGDGEVTVQEEYVAHGSLTYGADWCHHAREAQHSQTSTSSEESSSPGCRPSTGINHNGTVSDHQRPSCTNTGGDRDALDSQLGALELGSSLQANAQAEGSGDGADGSDMGSSHEQSQAVGNGVLASSNRVSGEGLSRLPVKDVAGVTSQDEPSPVRYGRLVATCSFYDRSLHLWKPKSLEGH